jgi:Raf kinase inhibitor-like YbhB/YbcL family protein
MKSAKYAALTILSVIMSTASAGAQNAGNAAAQAGPPVLAKAVARPRGGTSLLVTSPAFASGQDLDDKYTQNGDNMSPPLAWSKGPAGTRSYVVLAEDAGVNRHDPVFHWVVYNIPSNETSLSENLPREATLDTGAMQGLNARKSAGFLGPKPPAGQTHPYHFEVFALNTKLDLDPAKTDRNAVLSAMKEHVLAAGDVVADYTGK